MLGQLPVLAACGGGTQRRSRSDVESCREDRFSRKDKNWLRVRASRQRSKSPNALLEELPGAKMGIFSAAKLLTPKVHCSADAEPVSIVEMSAAMGDLLKASDYVGGL